ncbi:MAG: phage resistance protein, partial [Planctomycetaceae bacterium]
IRELPDSSFENGGDDWRVVIDYPFDEPGYGPRDDLSKLQRFKETHPNGTKTLCWVPSFFSPDAEKDLGLLVILEHVLMGERFGQYSAHLSPQDRQAAKTVLENQRSVLRQRVQQHLDAAYGLDVPTGSLDTTHDLEPAEHCVSLAPGLVLQPPVAANLGGALQHLGTQALEHEF